MGNEEHPANGGGELGNRSQKIGDRKNCLSPASYLLHSIFYLLTSDSCLLLIGGLCYYLALPPVNFAPLALAVPICWGIVIQKERGT